MNSYNTNSIQIFTGILSMLSENEDITLDLIRDVVSCKHELSIGFKNSNLISEEQIDSTIRELETQFQITQEFGNIVHEIEYVPWLKEKMQSDSAIDRYYWNRLHKYLRIKNELPIRVVSALDRVTDQILDLAGDPTKEGDWFRRGMVLGHVQSGKTSNYSALICKAADHGYKVIVLLTGISNSLRTQTQERINETFIGTNASNNSVVQNTTIGVGHHSTEGKLNPISMTTLEDDFLITNRRLLGGVRISQTKVPLIFVCKKNKDTLQNLKDYFSLEIVNDKGEYISNTPLLLIDDEADNASINTRYDKGEITAINNGVRAILNKFNQRSYVGYTATPFANIFIDIDDEDELLKDDLFPRDFIKSLDPPSNYIGPNRIFKPFPEGDLSHRMVRIINDFSKEIPLKHKKTHTLNKLPESLQMAIRVFILIKAIRIYRGDSKKHSTMMINVTVYNNVQENIEENVLEYIKMLKDDVILNVNKPNPDSQNKVQLFEQDYVREFKNFNPSDDFDDDYISEYNENFTEEFNNKKYEYPEWFEIKNNLLKVFNNIEVITVNGLSVKKAKKGQGEVLKYQDNNPKTIIAIGGYALSRGLTLEGLCVSYVIRKASAYDTLMQMGRWFGYRQNYEDLCRLYLPLDSKIFYQGVTEAIDELRLEIKQMEALDYTPLDFGLKVREHPGSIRITAANKMRSAEKIIVEIGLGGKTIETHTHFVNDKYNNENREQAKILFKEIGPPLIDHNFYYPKEWKHQSIIWNNISVEKIISFLQKIKVPNHCRDLHITNDNSSLALDFIEEKKDLLKNWTVVVNNEVNPTNKDKKNKIMEDISFFPRKRNKAVYLDNEKTFIFNKQKRMSDSSDVRLSFTKEKFKELENIFLQGENTRSSQLNFFLKNNIQNPIIVF